ncbi:MAG: DNA-formamidopyrimidine glycosylase family protein, partial [Pseudomonadota bacterium]|nr:DNA-formamidopyrimidine glycosylase family protein [Pseudomonadota bacterium]
MPELPEVETVRRGLLDGVCGRKISAVILRRPDLRFPIPPSLVDLVGTSFRTVRRRAKYLLVDTDDDSVVLIHLGMSGRWT